MSEHTAPSTPLTLAASVRRAGPLAIAGVATNASNIVVTVLIAHLLSSRGYGTLTQLIAMFLVLSMPGSALLVAVVRRVAAWQTDGRHDDIAAWIATVRRRGATALAAWAVLAVLTRGFLAHLLALPHPDGVAEILIAGGGWALLSVERGLLQSRRAYGALARNLCVEAGFRTGLTVLLVGVGLGVEGAALAVVASMAAAILDARRAPGDPVVGASASGRPPAAHRLTGELAVALGALGLLALLQNVDVLIVGHDAPHWSGPYGAISVASKAIVFGALVLVGYLLPEAVLQRHQGGHALHQLGVALGFVAVPLVVLVGIAAAAPHLVLRVAFGPDKTQAANGFATLALAMGALATSVLFTHYLLGIGHRRVVAILAAGAVALVVSVAAAHGQPLGTARAELACQATLAAVLAAAVLRAARTSPRSSSSLINDPVGPAR
jgi:O-antigen/teichoic acid export membrane protein